MADAPYTFDKVALESGLCDAWGASHLLETLLEQTLTARRQQGVSVTGNGLYELSEDDLHAIHFGAVHLGTIIRKLREDFLRAETARESNPESRIRQVRAAE